MKKVSRIADRIILIVCTILLIMSVLAIISIHWQLIDSEKLAFSFTPLGINNYLSEFEKYKELFAGTIATISAYFGILRLIAANDANKDKLRQDRFSEWKNILDIRFIEIEEFDPYMKREFIKIRYNLFLKLYGLDFSISNKAQLTDIFNNIFALLPRFFESQNQKSISMGEVYMNNTYTYSFLNFQFLFLGCFDISYPELGTDLHNLYLGALSPDRVIDKELFFASLDNIRKLKS